MASVQDCAVNYYYFLSQSSILTEMFINSIEKRLAALQSQWHETGIETLHVMRTFHIVVNHASTSRPEGFDRIELIFFHSDGLTTSNYRYRFPGMYAIRWDRVAIQIPNWFHLQKIQFNFVVSFNIDFKYFRNYISNLGTCKWIRNSIHFRRIVKIN